MKRTYRLRLTVALCASLTAVSCSSPNPRLYTIAPVSGPEILGAPKVIALHSVGIARYLQRSQIVQSTEDYRIEVSGSDWWGEPLDAMLGRVLTEDLSQRLPQSTVYTTSGAVSGSPQATVEVELQRLDLDRAGNLVLIAQASVSSDGNGAPDTRRFQISQPLPSPGIQGQVAATSTALGQVADRVAGMLAAQPRRK